MSRYALNVDMISPKHSSQVSLKSMSAIGANLASSIFSNGSIIAPTVTAGTFSNGTIVSPTVTAGTFSGCTILDPTISAGSFADGTIISPTVTAGTFSGCTILDPVVSSGSFTNISQLSVVESSGDFTVGNYKNESGVSFAVDTPYEMWCINTTVHLRVGGVGQLTAAGALTISGENNVIPEHLRPELDVYFPLRYRLGGNYAWGVFAVKADGSCAYYKSDQTDFADGNQVKLEEVFAIWKHEVPQAP